MARDIFLSLIGGDSKNCLGFDPRYSGTFDFDQKGAVDLVRSMMTYNEDELADLKRTTIVQLLYFCYYIDRLCHYFPPDIREELQEELAKFIWNLGHFCLYRSLHVSDRESLLPKLLDHLPGVLSKVGCVIL